MKVTAISDLHGNLIDIEPCDLLLICGDISPLDIQRDYIQMTKWIFNEFQEWIMKIDCPTIILTPGNHDFWFEKMITQPNTYLFNKLTILIDGETKVYNSTDDKWYKIYGTPWCKQCGPWAFMANHAELVKKYEKIPKDLDILMTHEASNLAEVGTTHDNGTEIQYCCAALTDEIKRKKPKYALCGHVHTGNHNITACPVYDYVFQEETEWTNVHVANVSILDESYSIYFRPTTFELSLKKFTIMKNYELVNLQLDEQNMNNDIMSQTEQDIYFEADELNDIAFVNELMEADRLSKLEE